MKRTNTLIRLRRFRVDDLKRRLGTLDAMKADVERKLADLEDSVARERQRAGDSDIGRLAFPSFLKSIEGRRENLRATHKDIERERAQAQEDLTSAFQDLKALEFATEQQAKRAEEVEARRAQSRLDEMALVRHLRKHALRSLPRSEPDAYVVTPECWGLNTRAFPAAPNHLRLRRRDLRGRACPSPNTFRL